VELIVKSRLLLFSPDEKLDGKDGHQLVHKATIRQVNKGLLDESYLQLGQELHELRLLARYEPNELDCDNTRYSKILSEMDRLVELTKEKQGSSFLPVLNNEGESAQ